MKKIIVIFLLMVFCFEPAAYCADSFDDKNQEEVAEKQTQKQIPSLSQIEVLYNNSEAIESGNILHQAGYDVFQGAGAVTSTTGKYEGNYKLSIGEKVNVYIYGDSVDVMSLSGANLINPTSTASVDSSGNLFIQGIGPVKAENRTVQEVENAINSMAAGKFKNTKVKLTVASGQDFSVFVYGYVNRPGKVLVGNNSSILDVLSAAGGVSKNGTLRNIKYTTGKKTVNVDLYAAIFAGNDNNIIVRPNDKIFVEKIGRTAAFKNGVSLPGIYEMKDNESVMQLATYAGGISPLTQSAPVILTRLNKTTNQRNAQNIAYSSLNSTLLMSGDIIEFKKLFNEAENTVTIQGNIKHPATYAYKDGMRLSDILTNENELKEETFINQAVIRRVSGTDNKVTTIPIFLKEFFAGMNDPILQPRDVITIYRNTNSEFVDIYGCINTPKHLTYTYNMTLKDVMTGIQFIESATENKEDIQQNNSNGEINVSHNTYKTAAAQNQNKLIPAENIAVEITSKDNSTRLYYLYDIMINSDGIKSIMLNADDKVFFRTLRDNEVMKTVKISGYVKNPGVYSFIEGKKLTDMIEIAGGLAPDADLRGIVYTRDNLKNKQVNIAYKNNEKDIQLLRGKIAGTAATKNSSDIQQMKIDTIDALMQEKSEFAKKYNGQIALNIQSNNIESIKNIDNILVQDGDDIYIPKVSNVVSVIGEVYNEQSFVYKKGAKPNYYIKQVGGYTPNASKFHKYKVGVNGRAEKIKISSTVHPGDVIVVPRKISNNSAEWIQTAASSLQAVASLFVMIFGITKW